MNQKDKKNAAAKELQLVPEPDPLLGKPSTESIPSTQSTIQRPKTSPYNSPPVTIYVGPNRREYYVSRDLLQHPEWNNSCPSWSSPLLDMHSVDEDTGHVLVHYLYTSTYQTLDNTKPSTANNGHVEFKRAIQAYFTARTYKLYGLQQLAMERVRHYGMEITTIEIFDMVNQDFPEFLDKIGQFYDYLKEKAKNTFQGDCSLFVQDVFLDRISNVALNKILVKCVVELYTTMISRITDSEADCTQTVSERIFFSVEKDPSRGVLVEDSSAEESLVNAGGGGGWGLAIWGDAGARKKIKKQQEEEEAERIRKEGEEMVAAVEATNVINGYCCADVPSEAAPADDWVASMLSSSKKKETPKAKRAREKKESAEREEQEQLNKEHEERMEQERIEKEELERIEREEQERTEREEQERIEREEQERIEREELERFGRGELEREELERLDREATQAAEQANQNEDSSGWASLLGGTVKKETPKTKRAREKKESAEREEQEQLNKEHEERVEQERIEKEEQEMIEREEQERIEREEQERIEREEQEMIEREEQERIERKEQERTEKEEQERTERLDREAKAAAEQTKKYAEESSG